MRLSLASSVVVSLVVSGAQAFAASVEVQCSLDDPLTVAQSPADADSYMWWDAAVSAGRVVFAYRDSHRPASIGTRSLDAASWRLGPALRVAEQGTKRLPPNVPHVAALGGRFFFSWTRDYVDEARFMTLDGKLGQIAVLPVHFFEYQVAARKGRLLFLGQMNDAQRGLYHLSSAELDEQLRLVAGPTALIDAGDHLSFARGEAGDGARWLAFEAPQGPGSARIGALRADDPGARPVIAAVGQWSKDASLIPFFLAGIGPAKDGAILGWFDDATSTHGRLFIRRIGPDGSPTQPRREVGLVTASGFVLPALITRVGSFNLAVVGPTGESVVFDDEGAVLGRSALHLQQAWDYRGVIVAGQTVLTWLSCRSGHGPCDLFVARVRCASASRH